MKINGLDRACCIIYFDDTDGIYANKEVILDGEKFNNNTFYFIAPRTAWRYQSPTHMNRHICKFVDESERESLINYIVHKAKELGYELIRW